MHTLHTGRRLDCLTEEDTGNCNKNAFYASESMSSC